MSSNISDLKSQSERLIERTRLYRNGELFLRERELEKHLRYDMVYTSAYHSFCAIGSSWCNALENGGTFAIMATETLQKTDTKTNKILKDVENSYSSVSKILSEI